jgi:hypothetical protein
MTKRQKDKQHNGQKTKGQNNDLQNINIKRETRSPVKTGVSSGVPEG